MTERAAVLDMTKYRVPSPTVVIIDDQSTGRMVLTEILRLVNPLIRVVPFGNPVEAIEYIHQADVDMVVTDYMMPRLDGLQTTRELRQRYAADELPVVMTTIVPSRELLYRAFEAGVSEYLVRPLDPIECRLRFEKMLEIRNHFIEGRRHIESLDQRLELALANSHDAQDRGVQRLLDFDRAYDHEVGRGEQDVAFYSCLIARQLGCSDDEVHLLRTAASLHDIGMMALPTSLWAQPGEFSVEQAAQMRRHPSLGHDLLAEGASPQALLAAELALNHHERLDGSGYPRGLRDAQIPIMSRVVAVADVFNALVSVRHHRRGLQCEEALGLMRREMVGKLDSDVMKALANSPALHASRQGLSKNADGVSTRHA